MMFGDPGEFITHLIAVLRFLELDDGGFLAAADLDGDGVVTLWSLGKALLFEGEGKMTLDYVG